MAPRYMTSRKMGTSEYNTAFIPEVSSLHLVQPCTVTRLKQHTKCVSVIGVQLHWKLKDGYSITQLSYLKFKK